MVLIQLLIASKMDKVNSRYIDLISHFFILAGLQSLPLLLNHRLDYG